MIVINQPLLKSLIYVIRKELSCNHLCLWEQSSVTVMYLITRTEILVSCIDCDYVFIFVIGARSTTVLTQHTGFRNFVLVST